ncbi:MAG: zinc ribbon domain-containing protein [Dehalococcoidales bacterium]|nr:zinc ribbon domain-containing protein [Dehalococcoidales bacterium]MDP7309971.1 zinc ribbon domain-containing protein [Dehalococcoidales bacterium]MDP7409814.1 zinc ribbon domain-containing protein [Dehalococcoidales bacterium]MDP7676282.1 zinc ribbon domain-containing protein [Dehalococcoidales bacterium]HJM36926.1 zinc ribbon domain-containing protein [Dehalococcoidales bacterium]
MDCSQCGTENTDETKFCTNCGVKLVAPPTICPQCGAEVNPGVHFCGQCGQDVTQPITEEATITTCPKCGAEVSPGISFCGQCGQDITKTAVKETAEPAPTIRPRAKASPVAKPAPTVRPRDKASSVAKPAPTVRPRDKASSVENTSGQGTLSVIPEEIRVWSWGAFALGWIWGIGNNVWLALLGLLPFGYPIMAVVLGLKGHEWAWRSKRYDSLEQFMTTQDTWSRWGVWVLIGSASLFLLTILFGTLTG